MLDDIKVTCSFLVGDDVSRERKEKALGVVWIDEVLDDIRVVDHDGSCASSTDINHATTLGLQLKDPRLFSEVGEVDEEIGKAICGKEGKDSTVCDKRNAKEFSELELRSVELHQNDDGAHVVAGHALH